MTDLSLEFHVGIYRAKKVSHLGLALSSMGSRIEGVNSVIERFWEGPRGRRKIDPIIRGLKKLTKFDLQYMKAKGQKAV